MTSLIACLGIGKGTWTHVIKLIAEQEWDNVFLVTNQFGKDKFQINKQVEFIVIDEERPVEDLVHQIQGRLQGKINDLEVAVNLISGSGKEHMAVISAVLKLGLALRLVGASEKGLQEI